MVCNGGLDDTDDLLGVWPSNWLLAKALKHHVSHSLWAFLGSLHLYLHNNLTASCCHPPDKLFKSTL